MRAQQTSHHRRSIRRHQTAGLLAVGLLIGGVGSWATTSEISGAIIAPGGLVVDSNVKKIQHPRGGIVGQILARDGDEVDAGDVVLRLDNTITRARLAIIKKGLTELVARRARLEAERDGRMVVILPDELSSRLDEPKVARVVSGEQRLFELRKAARDGEKAQLRQRVEQLNQQIDGLKAQAEAKSNEIALIHRELQGARELWNKNLMPIAKMTSLEREATRVTGQKGELMSSIARVRAEIAQTELKIIQIDRNLGSEVATELRDIDAKMGEFVERKVAAEDELRRVDIRAPQDGIVHQSTAHTVGGVINPGETIMLIVPKADHLKAEARVNPADIDQLHVGQLATLRFSAFSQTTTPEIFGTVSRIGADVTTDERTGASYYTMRIDIPEAELSRLGHGALMPGMPVEVFVKTKDRRVLSYLVKPFTDQLARAFREE